MHTQATASSRQLTFIIPQDELRVYGGLMALRYLARKYEFRDEVRTRPITRKRSSAAGS